MTFVALSSLSSYRTNIAQAGHKLPVQPKEILNFLCSCLSECWDFRLAPSLTLWQCYGQSPSSVCPRQVLDLLLSPPFLSFWGKK